MTTCRHRAPTKEESAVQAARLQTLRILVGDELRARGEPCSWKAGDPCSYAALGRVVDYAGPLLGMIERGVRYARPETLDRIEATAQNWLSRK